MRTLTHTSAECGITLPYNEVFGTDKIVWKNV